MKTHEISDIKPIKSIVGTHRLNNENPSQYEYYSPAKDENGFYKASSFETIKLFLPQALGIEYSEALPENYLQSIFDRIGKEKCINNTVDIERIKDDYNIAIRNLNNDLFYITEKYINFRTQPKSINHVIFSFLPNDEGTKTISYLDFPSFDEYYENDDVVLSTLNDVRRILYNLSEIGKLSRYITNDNENAYLVFVYEIFKHMCGNFKTLYPSGIINYTAFKFCLRGYPYNTPSKMCYSVSNIGKFTSKMTANKHYLKNINAIISFLMDLKLKPVNFSTEPEPFEFKFQTLRNAYGISIALLALYAEKALNDKYISSSFTTLQPHPTEELKIPKHKSNIDYRIDTIEQ